MKRTWLLAIGLALVLPVIFLSGCAPGTTAAKFSGIISSQQEGIWVTGNGEVMAVPDIATLSLGIEVQAATVSEAQTQATGAMNKVMTALTDNGVAKKDIQTQRLSIYPVTKWVKESEEQIVIGYRVTNMVTAKIRDIDKTGTIIDAVARAGGDFTQINNIGFSIDDPSKYYEEAREKAMADAIAKAGQLAKLSDVTLGKPTYISESVYMPSPVFRGVAEAAAMPAPVETPISPGEMKISLTVQVAYAILD